MEHDWFVPSVSPGWESCRKCGIVRRADGKNKPCRGVVPVGLRAESPDDIVGHKTLMDGSHVPMRRDEADRIIAQAEAEKAKRAADMPDEKAAINTMWNAYQRLRELGWRQAVYCPKDGSHFKVIEAGSTGIFDAYYSGEWPTGGWFAADGGDLWPSHPVLFRLYPEDEAKEQERWAKARERFREEGLIP